MNKKRLVIGILSTFVLTISAVSFTEAQIPPPPTPVPDAAAEPAPTINSPREACQYYDSRWERAIYIGAVRPPTENDCLYKVAIDENRNSFSYIHAYYSGNKFCVSMSGASSKAAQCRPIPQTGRGQGQQQKTPTKIATPVKSLKTPQASDSQAFNDLLNFSRMISNAVNQTAENLRSFFDSIFNNAKKFFHIKS